MIIRLLIIIGLLGTVLFFFLNKGQNSFVPPFIGNYLGQVKGLKVSVPKVPNVPQNPEQVKEWLQTVASNDSVKKIIDPLINDAQKTVENAPGELYAQLPKLIEIITNSKKEELYLISPQSLILPKVEPSGTDQEVTSQLGEFEVKDNRKSGNPWKLIITAKPVSGSIAPTDISFKLGKDQIQALEGNTSGISVEDGSRILISASLGAGKGIYKFKPFLTVKIHAASTLEDSRIEISSSFE